MMTMSKFTEYMSAEPFCPFRIKMASGQVFDIRHPEMILIGRSNVRVYMADTDVAAPTWKDVSMMLMETLEPIDFPTSASK
jgi:hypothetical protein